MSTRYERLNYERGKFKRLHNEFLNRYNGFKGCTANYKTIKSSPDLQMLPSGLNHTIFQETIPNSVILTSSPLQLSSPQTSFYPYTASSNLQRSPYSNMVDTTATIRSEYAAARPDYTPTRADYITSRPDYITSRGDYISNQVFTSLTCSRATAGDLVYTASSPTAQVSG